MGIFSNRHKVYEAKWIVAESYRLDADELAMIDEAEVVPSEFGTSVMFAMCGRTKFAFTPIDMDQQELFPVGTKVDPEKCLFMVLQKGVKSCDKVAIDVTDAEAYLEAKQ